MDGVVTFDLQQPEQQQQQQQQQQDLHNTSHNTTTNDTCPDPLDAIQIDLSSLEFIAPAITLIIFNIVVIGGNSLVIIAVFTSKKLRGVTNTYIVSLAFSDLFLGLLVLPFSAANEILRYWAFGDAWCSIWLAVDVWLSTASILNLCAISFDRFLAVSKPFKYPSLMSPLKAKLLVGAVWAVSFLICFPPLIGWNERGEGIAEKLEVDPRKAAVNVSGIVLNSDGEGDTVVHYSREYYYYYENFTDMQIVNGSDTQHMCQNDLPQCVLTSEPGYIIYSALGSFWIPVWIMAFFYWKIYRTAVKTTSAIHRGVLTTKTITTQSSENAVTLRIHRGGSSRPSITPSQTDRLLSPNDSHLPRRNSSRNSSRKSTSSLRRPSALSSSDDDYTCRQIRRSSSCKTPRNGILSKKEPKVRITFKKRPCKFTLLGEDNNGNSSLLKSSGGDIEKRRSSVRHTRSLGSSNGTSIQLNEELEETSLVHDDDVSDVSGRGGILNKVGRMNIKSHLRRINKEKKAAKTVGIIVGGFIVCWAPFFSVYLLGAFCQNCTPMMVFTIFFWLGYCNSAINPFVYALFSKDFRYAFKKLLRCRCERKVTNIRDRKNSRFASILNSLKVQISSKESNSNSE